MRFHFFDPFWILTLFVTLPWIVYGLRYSERSRRWYVQSAILLLLGGCLLFPKLQESPPTRVVLLDLSWSFQPRVLADLQKGSQSEIVQAVQTFVHEAKGAVGFGVFGRSFHWIYEPNRPATFLREWKATSASFQEWIQKIDPSQTALKTAEETILKDFEHVEILLFSDGQFSWNDSSESERVCYLPKTLEESTQETRILFFQGPARAKVKQGISLRLRLEGDAFEERDLFVFQDQQLLFRQRVRFSEASPRIDLTIPCPAPATSGAVSYQAKLLPSESEVLKQDNEKMWTVFFQEQPQLLLLGPTSLRQIPGYFQELPYRITFGSVSELTGQKEQLLPFQIIGYFPEPEPLPLKIQETLCRFVEDGGLFVLFGNRWISQWSQQPVESILPVTCGGIPEKIAIRVVLDCSGSMGELEAPSLTKLQLCTQALEQLMRQIPTEALSFLEIQFWAVNEDSKNVEIEELRHLQARGKTLLGKALHSILFPPTGGRKLLILLSDGETQDESVFVEQGTRLRREQVRLVSLQLPSSGPQEKGGAILRQFLGETGVLISIQDYAQLQKELWNLVEEETQLFYRKGPFEVFPSLPPLKGYARARLKPDALEKQMLFSEPLLAFRSVKQGASAFFAIDPLLEEWKPHPTLDAFLLERVFKPLESCVLSEVIWRSRWGKVEIFSKQISSFWLKYGDQRKFLEPLGFGFYQIDIPEKWQASPLELYQNEQFLALLPGETEPELQHLFVDFPQLLKLPSKGLSAFSRSSYSPFLLIIVIILLFLLAGTKFFLNVSKEV